MSCHELMNTLMLLAHPLSPLLRLRAVQFIQRTHLHVRTPTYTHTNIHSAMLTHWLCSNAQCFAKLLTLAAEDT